VNVTIGGRRRNVEVQKTRRRTYGRAFRFGFVDNTWELQILSQESSFMAPLLLNLFILLSYPLNFFIYCGMSRQFRVAFRELCCLCCGAGGAAAAQRGATNTDAATAYASVALNDIGDDGAPASRRQTTRRRTYGVSQLLFARSVGFEKSSAGIAEAIRLPASRRRQSTRRKASQV